MPGFVQMGEEGEEGGILLLPNLRQQLGRIAYPLLGGGTFTSPTGFPDDEAFTPSRQSVPRLAYPLFGGGITTTRTEIRREDEWLFVAPTQSVPWNPAPFLEPDDPAAGLVNFFLDDEPFSASRQYVAPPLVPFLDDWDGAQLKNFPEDDEPAPPAFQVMTWKPVAFLADEEGAGLFTPVVGSQLDSEDPFSAARQSLLRAPFVLFVNETTSSQTTGFGEDEAPPLTYFMNLDWTVTIILDDTSSWFPTQMEDDYTQTYLGFQTSVLAPSRPPLPDTDELLPPTIAAEEDQLAPVFTVRVDWSPVASIETSEEGQGLVNFFLEEVPGLPTPQQVPWSSFAFIELDTLQPIAAPIDDLPLFVASPQTVPWLPLPFLELEAEGPALGNFFMEEEPGYALTQSVTWNNAAFLEQDTFLFISPPIEDFPLFVPLAQQVPWYPYPFLELEAEGIGLFNFFMEQEPGAAPVQFLPWSPVPVFEPEEYLSLPPSIEDEPAILGQFQFVPSWQSQFLPWFPNAFLELEEALLGISPPTPPTPVPPVVDLNVFRRVVALNVHQVPPEVVEAKGGIQPARFVTIDSTFPTRVRQATTADVPYAISIAQLRSVPWNPSMTSIETLAAADGENLLVWGPDAVDVLLVYGGRIKIGDRITVDQFGNGIKAITTGQWCLAVAQQNGDPGQVKLVTVIQPQKLR